MTVEFEGSWVKCSYKNDIFESSDRTPYESGKQYWLIDVHGQIERCALRSYGKDKTRIAPKARYLDTDDIVGWIPDDRKIHIARLMTDGDWDYQDWEKFSGCVEPKKKK
ncbi:MAG: hypothetical protein J6W61_01165 [Bacteroidales bacterium]|nr:hypothetical protein [Bacteroidales bacterium]